MAASKRGIVFDFDGVIVDSWELHQQAWDAVLRSYGHRFTEDADRKTLGMSVSQTAEVLTRDLGLKVLPDELAKLKYQKFAEGAGRLKLMVGAQDALKRMCEAYPVGIVSLHQGKVVTDLLDRFNLSNQATVILTGDDTKEDGLEELLRTVAGELGTDLDQMVMIDDSRHGILAAKRIAMKAIAFDSHPKHEIDYTMADAQIRSLDELMPELVSQVLAAA